jgi:hypothetical protein
MVNILLVIYTRAHLDECLFRLKKISSDLFPTEETRFIISDTSMESNNVTVDFNKYFLSPGNQRREFFGWEYALQFAKDKFELTNEDIFIIVNDTFYRNYGDEYLRGFYNIDLYKLKYSKKIIGYTDAYPLDVSMGGVKFREWIRTSFFITGFNVLRSSNLFRNPYNKQDILNTTSFFSEPSPLSENYKSYISSWLFSDIEGRPEFPHKWHSSKTFSESGMEDMIHKAYCILTEHFISWQASKLGIEVQSINAACKAESPDFYMKTFIQFNLGIENKERSSKCISNLLFHDAYWSGSLKCETQMKILWLSLQSWAKPYFYPDECESYDPYIPMFNLKNLFFECRPELKMDTDNDYSNTPLRELYDLFFGDFSDEFSLGKPELEWLKLPSGQVLNSISEFELSKAFQLIYEFGMKRHQGYNAGSSNEDANFLVYLTVYSKKWFRKACASLFLDFISNNKSVYEDACYDFIFHTFGGVRKTSMIEVLVFFRDKGINPHVDQTLILCLLDIYSASYLQNENSIDLDNRINRRYLLERSRGVYRRDRFLDAELPRDCDSNILSKLQIGLMADFLEYYEFSAEEIYNFNDFDRAINDRESGKEDHPKSDCSIIGFSRSELGTGEDTRNTALVLDALGVDTSVYCLMPNQEIYSNSDLTVNCIESDKLGALQIYTMPPTTYMSYYLLNSEIRNSKGYKIGYFAWEFSEWKSEFDVIYDVFDEIWVISPFLLDAFDANRLPVLYMPPVVTALPVVECYDFKFRLGLPHDSYVFLSIFDIKSSVSRKNPIATVRSFLEAFRSDEKVSLVLKFSYDKKDFEVNAELFDLIESAENIYHISDMLSKSEINDLIAQSDTLISLHRSEGFGRVIAEAMLLNTQVVCTNYSGNLAFCNESNSLLVGYDLIPVEGSQYPFSAGLMWADVNFDSAVLKIKQAFTDLEGRVRREKCAYDTVIRNHSIDSAKTAIGCRVKALLEVISKGAK